MGIEESIHAGAEAERQRRAQQKEANRQRARREREEADRRAQFAAELKPVIERFLQRANEHWTASITTTDGRTIHGWVVGQFPKQPRKAWTLLLDVTGKFWCYGGPYLLRPQPWQLAGANSHISASFREKWANAEPSIPFLLGELSVELGIEL